MVHLAPTRYAGANHTHLSELLSERERIDIGRITLRRILVNAGLSSPRSRRLPKRRVRRNGQDNHPGRKPETANPGNHLPPTFSNRMRQGTPPDYGLVSHDDQGQIRDGPEGLSGDG